MAIIPLDQRAVDTIFAFFFRANLPINGVTQEAGFAVLGRFCSVTKASGKVWIRLSTECLQGSSNHIYLVVDEATGEAAFQFPWPGWEADRVAIETFVTSEDGERAILGFLEGLPPEVRLGLLQVFPEKSPFEHFGRHLPIDFSPYDKRAIHGVIASLDGTVTVNASGGGIPDPRIPGPNVPVHRFMRPLNGTWIPMVPENGLRGFRRQVPFLPTS